MRVGWIGLGQMGLAMAACAARAGHRVVGHTRGNPAHHALVEAGGTLESDAVAVASGCEILCINVFTDAQVREVLLDGGVLAAMRPGAILVIHTTGDPALAAEVGRRAPANPVLDGAFSGTPQQAIDGTLTIMAGGDAQAFATARPLFEAYAAHVAHVGPLGAGMRLKLLNNLLFAANVRLAEAAYALGAAQGFPADTVRDILGRCSAASRALEIIGAGGDVTANAERMRFYTDKDVAVASAIAENLGLDLGLVGKVAANCID